jgi:excisionase family DNA binding protein
MSIYDPPALCTIPSKKSTQEPTHLLTEPDSADYIHSIDIIQKGGEDGMTEPEHYTTAEVAIKLRMTPDGVLKRIKRGELEAVHVGKRWLIRRDLVDAMLQPQAPQGQ